MSLDRRSFVKTGAAVTGGALLGGPLQALGACSAGAAPLVKLAHSVDYGPLYPVKDQATGLELLKLPRGFEYISHGWTGDMMTDGRPTPGAHDGMAAFRPSRRLKSRIKGKARDHWTALVRNHEQGGLSGAFTEAAYDPMANGGTTNLIFDMRAGEFLDTWASLSGTLRNCAGGPTPWGTWLSCEETTWVNGEVRHGYIFEVPHDGVSRARPYKAMGRFTHEAVAVDPVTGHVYETEDDDPAGVYRFRPRKPGTLAAGGVLEMMRIGDSSYDTRHDGTGTVYPEIDWVRIAVPDPAPGGTSTVRQGIARGGAVFSRLEGAWHHAGKVYLVSTSGGPSGLGQLFEYDLRTGTMKVLFTSPDASVLNNPDNICVSPRGGIVLCEDGWVAPQHLHGLTAAGEIFPFAANNVVIPAEGVPGKSVYPGDYTGSEWCGATFDTRRGDWLFVNIQTPGITFAITGPWRNGSL
ncbi:PhoX family protein [Rhizohabitans arisaemae]|uniref:PhoX family protein n=1 Tax=Rhizohabitans arisaemae TaxID=2720610 RepID=UPI0024B2178B|nr:alkaline phosphatase PhoX [Rhizohabitans arisaemae]